MSGGILRRMAWRLHRSGTAEMVTYEPPVPLFVPPDTVTQPTTGPPPPRPPDLPPTSLVVGLAAVDHSGRVRDRLVLAALGWGPGDHTRVTVAAQALVLRRVEAGGVPIDARGRVFLPVGARTQFGITTDEQVLLVAAPQRALLIVHPVRVLTTLLADFYTAHPEALDDDA